MPGLSPTDVREFGTSLATRSQFCPKCQEDGTAWFLESAQVSSTAENRRAGCYRVQKVAQPSVVERLCQCVDKTRCGCPSYFSASGCALSSALSSFFDKLAARLVEVRQITNLEIDEDVRRSTASCSVLFGSKRADSCLSCGTILPMSSLAELAKVREATARELLRRKNLEEVYEVFLTGAAGTGSSSLEREHPNAVADRAFDFLLDCMAGKLFLDVVRRSLRPWVEKEMLAKITKEAQGEVQSVPEPLREMHMALAMIAIARKAFIGPQSIPRDAYSFVA